MDRTEPHLHEYDPEKETVVIPPENFEISLYRVVDDGNEFLRLQITSHPAGTYRLAETSPGRPGGPRQQRYETKRTDIDEVFRMLYITAIIAAESVERDTGVKWKRPFHVRLVKMISKIARWWNGVKARDARVA